MLKVRDATATDVQRFCKVVAPMWFIGVVAEEHGEVIGAGWIVWGDEAKPWVCFEGDDRLKRHKVAVARWSMRLVQSAQQVCDELYTMEDETELLGSKWLEWLGFRDTGKRKSGHRILRWQRQS